MSERVGPTIGRFGGVPGEKVGSLFFVGNATTILRYGELTLLTDPNFLHQGQRAYLGHGLTSKRLTEPALQVGQLPALHAVVLSHLHGDHWDRVAQKGLDRDLPIITTPHASKRLQLRGFTRAVGLRTWSSYTVVAEECQVRITALPGRHSPKFARRLLPPVMGSMLEFGPIGGPPCLRVYISGDTLLIDELQEIPVRYPRIDTGIFHLGGTTLPGGLMVTMNGTQGARLLQMIGPEIVVPVHYDDYAVFKSPLADFLTAARAVGLSDRVISVERGDTVPLLGRSATGPVAGQDSILSTQQESPLKVRPPAADAEA